MCAKKEELFLIFLLLTVTPLFPTNLPTLNWQERSDWINVKTDINPPLKATVGPMIRKLFRGFSPSFVMEW